MIFSLWLIFGFLILQRLTELVVARRNEKWMKNRGGYEVGAEHYKWFVIVHSLFFVSILLEVFLRENSGQQLNFWLVVAFLVAQAGRFWCLFSLGRFWNTKIIILPGAPLISRGPYRFLKHPNYWIVGIELMIIPLLFQAYFTAAIFPILHILLLRVRIPEEERALHSLKS